VSLRQNNVKHGGEKTREGSKSGVGRLERMKNGKGIKGQEVKSDGIEMIIVETLT
jgi:hypothetical protein